MVELVKRQSRGGPFGHRFSSRSSKQNARSASAASAKAAEQAPQGRKIASMPVRGLVLEYTAAGFVGLCGQAAQVAMDGYFVGNGLGELGLSTIAIVVPLLSFAMAVGCMLGVGSTSLAALALGAGNEERARSIYGATVWLGLFCGLAIALFGFVYSDQIAVLLGSTIELLPSCSTYIRRYFLFFPFVLLGCIWYYYVRLDEKPIIGTFAFVVPVAYAVLAEYFMIFHLGAGMESSSTAFGLTVGSWALCGLYFLFSKKTLFKTKLTDIKRISPKFLREIAVAGFAACTTQIAVALIAIIVNFFLVRYGTTTDIAAFGVLNGYILYIFSLIVTLAFAPSVQPIASFNIGAHAFDRVRQSLLITCAYSIAAMGLITIFLFCFHAQILGFFIGNDPELLATAAKRMPFYIGLFALGSVSFVVAAYYQAIESDKKAVTLSLMLNCLSLVPVMALMTHLYGGNGIWYSMPLCDILTFAISIFFVLRENKRLKALAAGQQPAQAKAWHDQPI